MNIKTALLTALLFAAVSTTSALAHVEEEVNDICFGRSTTCGTYTPTERINDEETITEPVIIVTDTPKPIVIVTAAQKVHCNTGNGNGPEGCNASVKGNEDETKVKGDKADGRVTGK
jgi:hypothetical protein